MSYDIILWRGVTHHVPLCLLGLWRRLFCRCGWHLFDEVDSSHGGHHLSCDACEMTIYIDDGRALAEASAELAEIADRFYPVEEYPE